MRDIRNDQQDRTNMIVGSMAAPFAGLASAQEFGGIRRVAPLDPRSATPAGIIKCVTSVTTFKIVPT
jgi:hypothetical protein